MSETPNLRWFEQFPKCGCGKTAAGILRGSRNESYGYHCNRCAAKRLKASEKVQEKLRKEREFGAIGVSGEAHEQ